MGVAFAAIAIGALVRAAVMSIAAANLFTRNVWKEFIHKDCSDQEESQVAKLVSLVVKAGALAFVLFLPTKFSIDLQLLGGVWMLQTLPAVMVALYALVPSLGPPGRLAGRHGGRHVDRGGAGLRARCGTPRSSGRPCTPGWSRSR